MKIKWSTVDLILICLSFVEFSFVPNFLFTGYMYLVVIYCLIKYFSEIFEDKLFLFLMLGYLIVLTYSTMINMHKFTWTLSAFMSVLQIVAAFATLKGVIKNNGEIKFIQKIITVFASILIVNDFLLFILPYDYISPSEQYVVGNKFYVVYYHCLLASLVYYYVKKIEKCKYLPLLIVTYTLGVSLLIHCTTGIIMSAFLIIAFVMPTFIQKILGDPLIISVALIVENILIWGSFRLFSNPTIQHIMTNVLHKSSNLTGRQRLYDIELILISQKPLFGYGYKTDIFKELLGYGNAQNGMFDIVIQAGIIGASFYFVGLFIFAWSINKKSYNYILGMYIMALVIAATVEISLCKEFILCIAIINAVSVGRTQKDI